MDMEPLPTLAEFGNTPYVKISSQNVKISLNAARKSILGIFAMLTLMADIYELVLLYTECTIKSYLDALLPRHK